ncbi:PREDICTED: uncharacterized protein LOC107342925 [Acropora digitifera]|uniref:uncharacterized protein LOC107342925 n=1 Tax=Acropora digitifera TaxID=70779 RepID=UPI00077A2B82|nr:PREDICTED: uncharacterized protein LOC107342925 [Acropora digitifera]
MAMTTSNAQQERQLLLMERMSGKIDSIVESQKKLEDANWGLQQENERLRIELQKKEKQKRRGSRISRRSSTVKIPSELRKRFRFIYKKIVEKKMSQGFSVEEE